MNIRFKTVFLAERAECNFVSLQSLYFRITGVLVRYAHLLFPAPLHFTSKFIQFPVKYKLATIYRQYSRSTIYNQLKNDQRPIPLFDKKLHK